MNRIASVVAAIVLLMGCATIESKSGGESLKSPDGRTEVTFEINEEGEALYSVTFASEEIIAPSKLSIATSCGEFDEGLEVVETQRSTFSEVWEPVWGQYAEIENHFNEMVVTLKNGNGECVDVTFRLFDDGMALRYTLNGEGACDILDEETEFRMAADFDAHWMAGSDDDAEFNYMHTPLSGITPETMQQSAGRVKDILECGVATPVAMKSPAGN